MSDIIDQVLPRPFVSTAVMSDDAAPGWGLSAGCIRTMHMFDGHIRMWSCDIWHPCIRG